MKKLLLSVLILALSGCAAEDKSASTSPEATATQPGAIVETICPKPCQTMACPPPNGTRRLCCPVLPYTQTCP